MALGRRYRAAMNLLFAAGVAMAQSLTWHATDVSGGDGVPFAVGTTMGLWSPGDEVYFVRAEHEVQADGDRHQSAILSQWRCQGACATPELVGEWPLGRRDAGRHLLHPSVVVHDRGDVRQLFAARATYGYRHGCAPNADGTGRWDLAAFEAHGGVGVVSTVPLEYARDETECTDWGRLQLTADDDGVPWVCYTHASPTSADRVRCRSRAAPLQWGPPEEVPTGGSTDHPSVAVYDGEPIVVVHTVRGADHHAELMLPGAATPLVLLGPPEVLRVNDPVVATGAGRVFVAVETGTTTRPFVRVYDCDLTASDCTDPSSWSHDDLLRGELFDASHPEIAVDPSARRLFVAVKTNVAPRPGVNVHRRVRVATRCLDDDDWQLLTPPEPADPSHDQALGYGRPLMVADPLYRVLHLSILESALWDERLPEMDDPSVDTVHRWLRASYADLPTCDGAH
jgi:hypothetical protein